MSDLGALGRVAALAAPRRGRVVLATALSAGAIVAAIGLMATSGYLIVRAAQQPPILTLTVAIVGVRAFATVRALLRYAERLASHDLALRVLGDLRSRLYARLAPLVGGELPGRRSGELLSRFVGDVDTLQDLYVRALTPPAVACVTVVVAACAAAVVAPTVGLALGLTLALAVVVVPLATAAAAHGAGRRQGPLRAALSAELVEALDGGAELAVLGRTDERLARLDAVEAELRRAATRDALAAGLASGLGSVLMGAASIVVLVTAVPLVQEGRLDGVLLGLLTLLALASAEGIAPLGDAARRLGACAAAAGRLEEITAATPPVVDPDVPLPVPGDGDLVARGLAVRADGVAILDGVELRVTPGRAVGVVGASGSGKTTLGRTLVRFRDPDEGTVELDGLDVRGLAQDELRRTVLLAEQDARVFATTVRENLRLANRAASEPELWAALRAVELEDEIATMPDGLDTDCGSDGDALSGGQRRRLLVARALLSPARFLVLDEPAAHLPPAAAQRLLRSLAAEAHVHGRGVLVLGHSAQDLAAFDDVHVLRAGRLRPAPSAVAAAP